LGPAALHKAVWWDLHLASLLTHLFYSSLPYFLLQVAEHFRYIRVLCLSN